MVERFPVSLEDQQVQKQHFLFFQRNFALQVLQKIPTAKSVSFLITKKDAFATSLRLELAEPATLWQELVDGKRFYDILGGELLFSLSLGDDIPVVACVQGMDEVVLQRLDEEWLKDLAKELLEDFSLICSAYVDLETGLPNLAHLQFLFQDWQGVVGGYLALVELPGHNTSFKRGNRYLRSCGQVLKNFVREPACLYYLGQRTFAMVFPCSTDEAGEEFHDFENCLIAYLKREGCHRVHVGSSLWLSGPEFSGGALLNRAWTALQHAEKRGPFSFCNYERWAHPELHQLAPVSRSFQACLRKIWASLSNFSLLLLKADSEGALPQQLVEQFPEQYSFRIDDQYYLLFPEDDGRQARAHAEGYLVFCQDYALGTFSGGIANYPYADFKKSEIPMNCKKALIHTSFFGPASVVTFDPTSLNISGDIYFAEGDFTKAIFEYRRGLSCEAGDVNLYNSLGVTLALMNRLKLAKNSFDQALQIEPDNFMALYNSGLALKDLGEVEQAFSLLERAYQVALERKEDESVMRDLELFLGILGVESAQSAVAVYYLTAWLEKWEKRKESGKVYRYLGLAYYGTEEFSKASKFLQKALNYDQFDAQSMAFLGHIYLKMGEGVDIASALCQKSVEIEPSNLQYQLFWGECMIACGDYTGAKRYLQRCQRSVAFRNQARLLLGELYLLLGKRGVAKKYLEKLLNQQELSASMSQRARQLLRQCEERA